MKTLTESLGTTTHIDSGTTISESTSFDVARSISSHESGQLSSGGSEGFSGDAPDHSVVVSISSTSGYEDSEIFRLPDAKTAKAFARRLMSTCVRAYDRRDWNAE
jgi:hypothetical protein